MMDEAKYSLLINMCAGEGYAETGRFYIGFDEHEANALFARLAGLTKKMLSHS